jgi:predicted DNA-binding transcriptional regulator AlpA
MDTTAPPIQARVLKTAEAAVYTGRSESGLEKMRCSGTGPPFVKLGSRSVGYLREDLDAWLASRRRSSTSEPGR